MIDKLISLFTGKPTGQEASASAPASQPQVPPALTQSPASTNAHSPVATALAQANPQPACSPEILAKANLLDKVVELLKSKIDFLPKVFIDALASLGVNLNSSTGVSAPANPPAPAQDEISQLMQMLGMSNPGAAAPAPTGASNQTPAPAAANLGGLDAMLQQLEKQLGALEQQQAASPAPQPAAAPAPSAQAATPPTATPPKATQLAA